MVCCDDLTRNCDVHVECYKAAFDAEPEETVACVTETGAAAVAHQEECELAEAQRRQEEHKQKQRANKIAAIRKEIDLLKETEVERLRGIAPPVGTFDVLRAKKKMRRRRIAWRGLDIPGCSMDEWERSLQEHVEWEQVTAEMAAGNNEFTGGVDEYWLSRDAASRRSRLDAVRKDISWWEKKLACVQEGMSAQETTKEVDVLCIIEEMGEDECELLVDEVRGEEQRRHGGSKEARVIPLSRAEERRRNYDDKLWYDATNLRGLKRHAAKYGWELYDAALQEMSEDYKMAVTAYAKSQDMDISRHPSQE